MEAGRSLPPPPTLLSSWLPSRARPRNLCFLGCVIKLSFAFRVPGPVITQAMLAKSPGPRVAGLQCSRAEVTLSCAVAARHGSQPRRYRAGCGTARPGLGLGPVPQAGWAEPRHAQTLLLRGADEGQGQGGDVNPGLLRKRVAVGTWRGAVQPGLSLALSCTPC